MRRRGLTLMLAVVVLDAVGMGLVLPIIPQLLRDVGHAGDLGWQFGGFLSLYAGMQFVCSPLLGAASDRYGRRPVLLLSLAGAAIAYGAMAVATTYGALLLGRAIAGMTGASMAVAASYVADVTPEAERAKRFGQLSACFGLGFIAGPALGGVLGEHWLRAPFLAAMALNALTLVAALAFLPESRTEAGEALTASSFNPFGPLRWAFSFPGLVPLLATFMVLALVGEVGGTIWVLYGQDRFAWGPTTVGVSLAGFGLFHALAQAFVAGPAVARWGERKTVLLGIAADGAAYVLIAAATHGWMAFALLPLFCLGGIGAPALQALMSVKAGEAHQGRLQGVMASMTGLASVVGPLAISQLYFASRGSMPGLVWLAGAALYLVCLPSLLRAPRAEAA